MTNLYEHVDFYRELAVQSRTGVGHALDTSLDQACGVIDCWKVLRHIYASLGGDSFSVIYTRQQRWLRDDVRAISRKAG